jgi:CHAD domain
VGHGSIVAPLAGTVAATIATTVVVGLGVALARAEHNRRSARARRGHDRQFALLPGEQLAEGLKRMALEQLDFAIELLEGDGGAVDRATAVHETRKSLKRLRALMAMLEQELDETVFAREDAALRDAGLRLAGARDAEVMLSALDGLLKRGSGELARRRGVVGLRVRLAAERDRAVQRALGDAAARVEVLGDLRGVRGRVAEWSLPDREGIGTVEAGLKRLYRQGRRRYRLARRGKGEVGQTMHQWRKRVKDLRYAMEMLDRGDPEGGDGSARDRRSMRSRAAERRAEKRVGGRRRGRRGGRRGGRPASRGASNRIRRLAREADELAELLGEDHDLVLLAARIRAGGPAPTEAGRAALGGRGRVPSAVGEGGAQTRKRLLRLIARRRERLHKQALRKGEHLYSRSPKRFVRRVGDAYARGSRS